MTQLTKKQRAEIAAIGKKHDELYKHTEDYLAKRYAAGQQHNPNWKDTEHEQG